MATAASLKQLDERPKQILGAIATILLVLVFTGLVGVILLYAALVYPGIALVVGGVLAAVVAVCIILRKARNRKG